MELKKLEKEREEVIRQQLVSSKQKTDTEQISGCDRQYENFKRS